MTNLVSINLPVLTVVGPVPTGDPDVTSDPAASFADLLAAVVTTDPVAAPDDKRDKPADALDPDDSDDPAEHLHPVPVDASALASAAVPISALAALAAAPAPAPASTPGSAPGASQGIAPPALATSAVGPTITADRPDAQTSQVGSALAELSRANGVAKDVEPAQPTATASPSGKPVAADAPCTAVTTSPIAHPVISTTTDGTGATDRPATTSSYGAVAPLVAAVVATDAGSPDERATTDADAPAKPTATTAAPVTGLAGGPTAPSTVAPAAAALPTEAAAPRSFPEVQQPLVASLARLRSLAGTHALTVHLHPADLGAVSVNATIRDGALVVSVACADQDAHAAVQAALPNLHHELKNAGFSGVDVSLGNQAQPEARQWLAEHGHRDGHGDNKIGIPEQPDASGPQLVAAIHRRPTTNAGIDRWM